MIGTRENVVRLLCAVEIPVLLDGEEPSFRNGDPLNEFEVKLLQTATVSEFQAALQRIDAHVGRYSAWLSEFRELSRRAFEGHPASTVVGDLEQTDEVRRLHAVHALLEESPVNDWGAGRDGLDKWVAS